MGELTSWAMANGNNAVIRPSAVLTTSYVAATGLTNTAFNNQLILYVDFTLGSLTTAEIKVEFSADDSDLYQNTYAATPSAGVSACSTFAYQLSATGKYRIAIPIKDKYITVSAKGTGTVTNSLMKISAFVGVA